jgi:hypothetical protein
MRFKVAAALILAFLTSSSGAAAPLCQSVFKSANNLPQNIEQTIEAIARFKLQADTLAAEGGSSTQRQLITSKAKEKMQEIYDALDGHMSREEIRGKIADAIARAQGNETVAKTVESVVRENQKSITYSYKPLNRKEIDQLGAEFTMVVEQTNEILLADAGKLTLINLDTLAERPIKEWLAHPRLLNDKFIFLDADGTVSEMALDTLQLVPKFKIQDRTLGIFKTTYAQYRMSQDGKKVLARDKKDNVYVYETGQGKRLSVSFKATAEELDSIVYLDDSHILLRGSRNVIVDLLFGNETPIGISDKWIIKNLYRQFSGQLLSHDYKYIYMPEFRNGRFIVGDPIADINNIPKSEIRYGMEGRSHYYASANGEVIFARFWSFHESHETLYEPKASAGQSRFENWPNEYHFGSVPFFYKNRIYLLRENANRSKVFIETWEEQ